MRGLPVAVDALTRAAVPSPPGAIIVEDPSMYRGPYGIIGLIIAVILIILLLRLLGVI